MSNDAGFKDRKVGLAVFGVIQMLAGSGCLLVLGLMGFGLLVEQLVGRGSTGGTNAGMMFAGAAFYLFSAAALIWMGVGSLQARRWARALWLTSSWIGLICGLGGMLLWCTLVPGMYDRMAELGTISVTVARIFKIVVTAIMSCLYIVFPGVLILFYGRKDVAATCHACDPHVRWTDKCPLPVLATSLILWSWGLSALSLAFYNFAIPFFGEILTGLPGAAAVLAAVLLLGHSGWGVYKLRPAAWAETAGLTALVVTSCALTFSKTGIMDYYAKMNFPQEQFALMQQMGMPEALLMWTMGLYTFMFVLLLIYIRRFFNDETAARCLQEASAGAVLPAVPPAVGAAEKKGPSRGAKWGIGCGSGCLVVVLVLIALGVWGYRALENRLSEVRNRGANLAPLPADVDLDPETQALFEAMHIEDPEIARTARLLLQPDQNLASHHIHALVSQLMDDPRPEGRRVAADLLDRPYHTATLFILRRLPKAGDQAVYFLEKIVAVWPQLGEKEAAALRRSLPPLILANRDNAHIQELAETIVARMIEHPSRKVPPAGIALATALRWTEKESVAAALRGQTQNEIFDYFDNVHPIRKLACTALGEKYTPPPRKTIDVAAISIAEQNGLEKSSELTMGVLASLYTATGPCAGGGDMYGWYGAQRAIELLAARGIRVLAYFHPIPEAQNSPIGKALQEAGIGAPILNAASVRDLALCDVMILPGTFNMRSEPVDALEEFVWNGGGLVTLEGAGIISCKSPRKLAALQDMRSLAWAWSTAVNEMCTVENESPLTAGLDFSLPVRSEGGNLNRNGYVFHKRKYEKQVLLTFVQLQEAALRISTYGQGRVAHFAWRPAFDDDVAGQRDWELFRRTVAWAAGKENPELKPLPANSGRRY